MENPHASVLCVDDEENILSALKRLLRREPYRLLTAKNAREGMEIIEQEHPCVVISDQRMPGTDGITFLRKVMETYPAIIRITLTGYTDVDTIREAVNQGHIYKFLLKPWNDENLILEIRQAVRQYDLEAANRELNKKVVAQNEELRLLNDHLERLVEQRTEEIIIRNRALELSQAVLSDLPIPIMGVAADGMIAMTNRALDQKTQETLRFQVGRSIDDYFPPEILEVFSRALSGDSITSVTTCRFGTVEYRMQCIPLTGIFKGRGVILAFYENG